MAKGGAAWLLALALCLPGAAGFGAPILSSFYSTGIALRSSAGALPSGIQSPRSRHSALATGGYCRRRPARDIAPRMNLFDLGETLNPFASRVDMVISDLRAL